MSQIDRCMKPNSSYNFIVSDFLFYCYIIIYIQMVQMIKKYLPCQMLEGRGCGQGKSFPNFCEMHGGAISMKQNLEI